MNAKKQKIIGYMGLMFVGVYAVALGLLSALVRIKSINWRSLNLSPDRKKRQAEWRYWDV